MIKKIIIITLIFIVVVNYVEKNKNHKKHKKTKMIKYSFWMDIEQNGGSYDKVKKATEEGAAINIVDTSEYPIEVAYRIPPLVYAVQYGDYKTVKYLLEKGADINMKTNYGSSLIFEISYNYNDLNYFLKKGLDIHVENDLGENVLVSYCKRHANISIKIIEYYLSNGIDVNKNDKIGNSAILYLCKNSKNDDCIELLLSYGANINVVNDKGMNSLIYSVIRRKPVLEIIQLLISKGIDLHHKDNKGKTALDYAIEKGNPEIIKLIKDAMEKQKQTPVISNTIVKEHAGDADPFIENTEEIKINWKVSETGSIELNKTEEIKLEK